MYLADDDTFILDQFLQYPGAGPRSSSRSPTRVLRRSLAAKDKSAPQDSAAPEINEIVEAQAALLGKKKPVLTSFTKRQAESPTDILSDQFSQAGPPSFEEAIESNRQTPTVRTVSPLLRDKDPKLSQIPETARDNPENNLTEEAVKEKNMFPNFIFEPQKFKNFIAPRTAMSDTEIQGDIDDVDSEKDVYPKNHTRYTADFPPQDKPRGRPQVPSITLNGVKELQPKQPSLSTSDKPKISEGGRPVLRYVEQPTHNQDIFNSQDHSINDEGQLSDRRGAPPNNQEATNDPRKYRLIGAWSSELQKKDPNFRDLDEGNFPSEYNRKPDRNRDQTNFDQSANKSPTKGATPSNQKAYMDSVDQPYDPWNRNQNVDQRDPKRRQEETKFVPSTRTEGNNLPSRDRQVGNRDRSPYLRTEDWLTVPDPYAMTQSTRKPGTIKSGKEPFDYLRSLRFADTMSTFEHYARKYDDDDELENGLDETKAPLSNRPINLSGDDETKKSFSIERYSPVDDSYTPPARTKKVIPSYEETSTAEKQPMENEYKDNKKAERTNIQQPQIDQKQQQLKESGKILMNQIADLENKFNQILAPKNLSASQDFADANQSQTEDEQLPVLKINDSPQRRKKEFAEIPIETFTAASEAMKRFLAEQSSDMKAPENRTYRSRESNDSPSSKVLQNSPTKRKIPNLFHPEELYAQDWMNQMINQKLGPDQSSSQAHKQKESGTDGSQDLNIKDKTSETKSNLPIGFVPSNRISLQDKEEVKSDNQGHTQPTKPANTKDTSASTQENPTLPHHDPQAIQNRFKKDRKSKKDKTSYLVHPAQPRKQSKARNQLSRFGIPKDVGIVTPAQLLEMEEFEEIQLDENDCGELHTLKGPGLTDESNIGLYCSYTALSKNNKIPNKPFAGLRIDPIVLKYHPDPTHGESLRKDKIRPLKSEAVAVHEEKEIALPGEQEEHPFVEKIIKKPKSNETSGISRPHSLTEENKNPTFIPSKNDINTKSEESLAPRFSDPSVERISKLLEKGLDSKKDSGADCPLRDSNAHLKQSDGKFNSTAPTLLQQPTYDYASIIRALNDKERPSFIPDPYDSEFVSERPGPNFSRRPFEPIFEEPDKSNVHTARSKDQLARNIKEEVDYELALRELNKRIFEDFDPQLESDFILKGFVRAQTSLYTGRGAQQLGMLPLKKDGTIAKYDNAMRTYESDRDVPAINPILLKNSKGFSHLIHNYGSFQGDSLTYTDRLTRPKIRDTDLLHHSEESAPQEELEQSVFVREQYLRKALGQPPLSRSVFSPARRSESPVRLTNPWQPNWAGIRSNSLDMSQNFLHQGLANRMPSDQRELIGSHRSSGRLLTEPKAKRSESEDEEPKTQFEKYNDNVNYMKEYYFHVLQNKHYDQKMATMIRPERPTLPQQHARNLGTLIKTVTHDDVEAGLDRQQSYKQDELAEDSGNLRGRSRALRSKNDLKYPYDEIYDQKLNWDDIFTEEESSIAKQRTPSDFPSSSGKYKNASRKISPARSELLSSLLNEGKAGKAQRDRSAVAVRSKQERLVTPDNSLSRSGNNQRDEGSPYRLPRGYVEKVLGAPTSIDDFFVSEANRSDAEPSNKYSGGLRKTETLDRYPKFQGKGAGTKASIQGPSSQTFSNKRSVNGPSRDIQRNIPKKTSKVESKQQPAAVLPRTNEEIIKELQISSISFKHPADVKKQLGTETSMLQRETEEKAAVKRELFANKNIGKYLNVNKKPSLAIRYDIPSKK